LPHRKSKVFSVISGVVIARFRPERANRLAVLVDAPCFSA